MKISKFFSLLFILLTFYGFSSAAEIRLLEITLEEKNRLIISFSEELIKEKLDYTYFEIKDPSRLIISFPKEKIYAEKKEYEFNRGIVKKVRTELVEGATARLDYLVIELDRSSFFRIHQEKNSLVINFESFFKERETPNYQEEEFPSTTAVSVDWCIKTALENSATLKIAEEEIKLARLKLFENARNLYPSLAARYEHTIGDAVSTLGVPSFTNIFYGLELAQPVYQGGGLYSAWKQAKTNLDLANKNYEKIKQDLIYEVNKAYYNLVKYKKNLGEQENLRGKADDFLSLAKRQLELGLITRLDFLNVETQFQGLQYQILSTQKDLALANINLNQTIGINYDLPLAVDAELVFKEVNIIWELVKQLAPENRPDLQASYLSLQVNKYSQDIARGLGKPRLDLTGFYGRSGGAFKNEVLKLKPDWNVGLKLSKVWGGGNTLSSSFFKEKTSPKLGQTTRTSSTTGIARISLLDNTKVYSDLQEAVINYDKAQNKYKELKENILSEGREAYYNYEKSLLQIQSNTKEIELASEEIKITETKFKLATAQVSDVFSTYTKLTNAKNSYTESLVFYYISIASLNKAVGIVDKWVIQ